MAVHAAHVETGLSTLAPARTPPDVGFNETSLLSLVIPTMTGLGRDTEEGGNDELFAARRCTAIGYLTVRHVVGAVEHLGRLTRRQSPTAIHRYRLHLQEVLAFELQVLQLVARLVLEQARGEAADCAKAWMNR